MDRCLTGAEVLRYLGGQLSADETSVRDEHLRVCAGCSARVERARGSSQPDFMTRHQAVTHVEVTAGMAIASETGSAGGSSHWSDLERSAPFGPDHKTVIPPRPASLSLDDFLGNLSQSGLLPPHDLATVKSQSTKEPTNTVATLIDWLIHEHKLTRYQAELIVRGQKGGLVLGNYVILEKLGQGGMGTVFKAKHRRMNRLVALKVLPSALSIVPEAIARFQREVEAAARLQHTNVAAAYDADEAEGVHFLVMEYVDGPTLAAYVKTHGAVPLAAAVKLAAQAARGLAAAHAQGIVHRDIKPSNLMVNRQGVLKVLDMGLAQMRGPQTQNLDLTDDVTQTGRVMGTVDYMAPEQARDAKSVDYRADLYSLGCTLFFLATGKTPAPGGSAAEKLLWHQTQEAPPLSTLVADASPRLDDLCQRLMAKQADERPRSMDVVAVELEACLAELPAGEADLAIGEIALAIETPGSTLGGSRFGQQTAVHLGQTMTSPSRLNVPLARPKSRMLMYACGLAGMAVLAAIAAAPMLGRRPARTTVVVAPSKSKPATPPTPIAANVSDESVRRVDAVSKSQITTSSPHAPYEKLLAWVFRNGGQVTAVTGKGEELPLSAIEQLPAEPLAIMKIRLDGTGVRDDELAALADAPGLRELSLADTRLTDAALKHLDRLLQLTRLNLSRTGVTSSGLTSIARLTHLSELDLSKTQVTDQGLARLAGLPNLQRLNLSDTALNDVGLDQLRAIASLTELKLNGTSMTDAGHTALVAALPDARISWDGVDLQRAVAVRLLDKGATLSVVDRTQQLHAGLKSADELPPGRLNVKRVDLSTGTGLDDADLKELVMLPEVETLSLAGANITAEGLGHLHSLASLKTIDLGTLRLPPEAITALQQSLANCQVLIRQPADVAVARLVIGRSGRVSLVTERGQAYNEVADEAKLPAAAYSIRSINLGGIADVDDAALAQFADLPELEAVFLAGTAITDDGVAQLAGCKSLRELSLSKTKITAASVGALTRLPSLSRLYLAETAIGGDGARQTAALPQLTHLSLQGVTLADDDLAALKRLENLEWLDLAATPLTDAALVHLNELAALKELNIAATGISDAGQEELQAALIGCRVLGDPLDPQRLAARWLMQHKGTLTLDGGLLTNAKDLPRDACRVLAVDIAELSSLKAEEIAHHLSACTDVVGLNLGDTPLKEADLAFLVSMPELRDLRLANLPVGDGTLKLLAEHYKLEILDLSGTRVTGAGLASLENATELKQLLLANTPIDERHFTALPAFTKLEALDLSASRSVSDAALLHVEQLAALKSLGLRGTKITDAACERVARLTAIESLDLSNTKVTDAGIARLAPCKKLRQLNLARTAITDSVASSLAPMKSLKQIDLAGNKISADSIKALRAGLAGCYITEPAQIPMGDLNSPVGPRRE